MLDGVRDKNGLWPRRDDRLHYLRELMCASSDRRSSELDSGHSTPAERLLICIDCHRSFSFAEEEENFYRQRGFRLPVRCLDCRAESRAERNADLIRAIESESAWTETWGHYGGEPDAARTNGHRRAKPTGGFPAICAQCGRDTLVPFEPRRGRPVFCRECYIARRTR
jgi:CxxC-x17-CxxC domain-containing protein